MINYKIIFFIIGILITGLSIAMIIPISIDIGVHTQNCIGFAVSLSLCLFFGVNLILANKNNSQKFRIRETFILTVLSWITLAFFAALPFVFSDLNLSYTDGFFESMSGLTTTGSTVITNLGEASKGILIWRSILQWFGGIGIIVVAIAILPMLKIGGMQLFRTESSDKYDKIMPQSANIAIAISLVYIALTITCTIILWGAGMSVFDAVAHAMTTVATAGFSTHDNSIEFFNNPTIEYTIIVFMILSSLPFVLYIKMFNHGYKAFLMESQACFFIILTALLVLIFTFWLYTTHQYSSIISAFRYAAFNIVSIATTTGFSSDDYSSWGSFAITFIFLISVIGGCTGSTSGGIKIFRVQILYQTAKVQINKLIYPDAVFHIRYNHKLVSENVPSAVMSFLILFILSFLILSIALSLSGFDYLSSMSAAASTLSNLGPALGPTLGPIGNFASLSTPVKWILSFGMLIGRLEVFTVLVLFSSYFWKD